MAVIDSSLSCLILAAGHSRRFGSAKLLHKMPDGRALIEHTISLYQAVFKDVRVVARIDDEAMHQRVADAGANLVTHAHAEDGISQSIVAGIATLKSKSGALIALGDMPFVKAETVISIADALRADSIVVPQFKEKAGNPVAFGEQYFAALLGLKGDIGARHLIKQHHKRANFLDVEDGGILVDIDSPSDLLDQSSHATFAP